MFTNVLNNFKNNQNPLQIIEQFKNAGLIPDPAKPTQTAPESIETINARFDAQVKLLEKKMEIERMRHDWNIHREDRIAQSENTKEWVGTIKEIIENSVKPAIGDFVKSYGQELARKKYEKWEQQKGVAIAAAARMRRLAAADGGVPPQQQQRGTGHRRVMIILIESHINYNNRENSRNLDSSTRCSGHDGPRLPRSPRSKGHPPWDNVILERVSFSRVAFMANMAVFFDEQLRELHSTTRRVEPCPPLYQLLVKYCNKVRIFCFRIAQ